MNLKVSANTCKCNIRASVIINMKKQVLSSMGKQMEIFLVCKIATKIQEEA